MDFNNEMSLNMTVLDRQNSMIADVLTKAYDYNKNNAQRLSERYKDENNQKFSLVFSG